MAEGGPIAQDRLRSFIERIERLEEEKTALMADIKEVYSEAKGTGFDIKTMRKVISLRKMEEATAKKPNFCSILIFRRLECSIDPWSQHRQPSRYFFKISRIRPVSVRPFLSLCAGGGLSDLRLGLEFLHPGTKLYLPSPGGAVLAVDVQVILGDLVRQQHGVIAPF